MRIIEMSELETVQFPEMPGYLYGSSVSLIFVNTDVVGDGLA